MSLTKRHAKRKVHRCRSLSLSPSYMTGNDPGLLHSLANFHDAADFAQKVAIAESAGLITHRQAAELDESIRLRSKMSLARYKLRVWSLEGQERKKREQREARVAARRKALRQAMSRQNERR